MSASPAPAAIRFLGTGNAFNLDGRGSPALLVDNGDGSRFLVDAGPTLMATMHRQGIDSLSVDRLFLTHLHGDHTAGWPFLVLDHVFRTRRSAPFHVHGPPGTKQCLEELVRCCYPGLDARRAHEIHYHSLPLYPARDSGGPVELESRPMVHHESSLGYRFRIAGRSVAVSGDTRWCDELVRLARGADLLVLECSDTRPVEGHVSLSELREGRGCLASDRIALVHLSDAVALDLARDPLPGVIAAYDGMSLELGAAAR